MTETPHGTANFTEIDGVLQNQMITESIGISDMEHEHLAACDGIVLTRRRLLTAAAELAARGTHPPAADRPADYLLARSGFFKAAENCDWLDVYRERLAAARAV